MSEFRHASHKRNRGAVVDRFVRLFLDNAPCLSPEEIVLMLRLAPQSEWKRAAEGMEEKKAPSIDAQREIIAHFAALAGEVRDNGMRDSMGPGDDRERAKEEGTLPDGRAYHVDVVADSMGWGWTIFVDGRHQGGWTPCPSPLFAIGMAKTRGVSELAERYPVAA
jgi:hypothetical protein